MMVLSLTLSGCGSSGGKSSKSSKKETPANSTLVEVSKLDGNTISYGSQAYFYISLKQKPSSEVVIPIKTSNPNEAILANDVIALKFTPTNYQNRKVILQGVKKDRVSNTQNYTIIIGKAKSDDARYDGLDLDDIEVKTNYLEVSPIKDSSFTPNVENFIHVNANYNGKYSLEYKLLKSPKGMKIDESGTISWTPSNEFEGYSDEIKVQIKDKLLSTSVSFKVNVSKPKGLQTKKLDNKEIEVISVKSNLKGLKIKLQNNSYTSTNLNLATVSENSVKEIPDFIQRFTDIFISKEPIKGKVSFKIPSSLLPKGVNLGDIDLYVLTFVNEFGKKIWSPVAMDKKYYKESGIDILDISLNGIVGEFFIGAEKSVINNIKPRSLKKKVYPRSANGIECKEHGANKAGYNPKVTCTSGNNTIEIENFYRNDWGGPLGMRDPLVLVQWLLDAQKGFERLGMRYDKKINVMIEEIDSKDFGITNIIYGYVTSGNNEDFRTLHLNEDASINIIKATAVHEYFHHALARTAQNSGTELYSEIVEGFFNEGLARWFEDYVYDDLDAYKLEETKLYNILNMGLKSTPLRYFKGETKHVREMRMQTRPYQRFIFYKMLNQYCSLSRQGYIPSLMVYHKNREFMDEFKIAMENSCDFDIDMIGQDKLTAFEKSLHFYQNAMMNKKDISILDKNEDNKKLKYDTSSIETYYGTIGDTSFNVKSYGVKSFILEPSKNNGFFEWLSPSAGGYDKLVLSFHSSHDASMSIANEEFQLYDVKKGDNTFDITDINYKSFITIANNLSEYIEISNLKIDKQEMLERKAEFEIMIEDNPKVLYDLSKYKVYLKFKNTNKPNDSKDIEWGSSSAGASDATIENGILNIPDIDDDKQNVSLKIRATFDGVTVYKDVIIENKPKTCRDDNQGCPKCQSDETLKYRQDGSGYCEVKIQKINTKPVAFSQNVSVYKNTVKWINLLGSDADSDPLNFKILYKPSHGTLDQTGSSVTYIPDVDYVGKDGFTYLVNDGKEDSSEAKVSISITQEPQTNTKPVALAQNLEVYEDNKLSITLKGKDDDGDSISDYEIVQSPKLGRLTGASPNLSYQRENGYIGQDFFTFRVYDGKEWSDEAKVIIQIKQIGLKNENCVNKGDETVMCYDTNLIWQDNTDVMKANYITWEVAMEYCENLALASKNDWRLPSLNELIGIVDTSNQPALKDGFSQKNANIFWSSNSYDDNTLMAWNVDFDDGDLGLYDKSYFGSVRCVRDAN